MLAALAGNEGAEILEFAISLPLLLVVAVGVFDFGSAFTVKQKVGNVALQGARFASNQPTTDLSLAGACGAPASICSVRDVVESNLVASRLNDCGLGTVNGTGSGSLAWTFTANAGCGGTLTLTVERGYVYTATLPAPPFQANYTIEGIKGDVELSLSVAVQPSCPFDSAGRELSRNFANQLGRDHAEFELKDGSCDSRKHGSSQE